MQNNIWLCRGLSIDMELFCKIFKKPDDDPGRRTD